MNDQFTITNQGLLARSASDPEGRGMLGITPKPFLAILSCEPNAIDHSFRDLAYVPSQARDLLHKIRKLRGRLDCFCEIALSLSLAFASLLCVACKEIHAQGFSGAIHELSAPPAPCGTHLNTHVFGSHLSLRKILFRKISICGAYRYLLEKASICVLLRTFENKIGCHSYCVDSLFHSGCIGVFSYTHNSIYYGVRQ